MRTEQLRPGLDPRTGLEVRSDALEIREEPADGGGAGQGEGGGDPVAEIRTAVQEFTTNAEQRLAALDTALGEVRGRLDRTETRLNRPGVGAGTQDNQPPIETRAFWNFVRRGEGRLTADEVRALRVADDTAGGYLAPDQFLPEILKGLVQVSPIRQAARIRQTSAGAVIIPRLTGRPTAHWVGETEERPETNETYGQEEITAHEAACWIDVSQRLLEDAAVDIAAELSQDFAMEFGRLEGVAFVNGNGVKKPFGVMSDPSVPSVPNGATAPVQLEALIDMMYALHPFYRGRGSWLMNGRTIATVRKFRTTTGEFIWGEGLNDGEPPTLLGRPVIEAPDMPDAVSGAYPIVFGDFATAYSIVDRVGLAILRDPFTQATRGLVRFHARRRVGAAVVMPEALRTLHMVVS